MYEILRNMARRKVRSGLTVFGIVIGIFALTVMGSMSEYFNTMLENAIKYSGKEIGISPKEGGLMPTLSESVLRKVERVDGVKQVIPSAYDTLEKMSTVQMGMPNMVIGVPAEQSQLSFSMVSLTRGRWLQRGDTYHAVLGSKLARKKNVDPGGTITWREKDFTVVGIMGETQTSPDNTMLVPLDTMRRVMKSPVLIISAGVVPTDPSRIEDLARRINEQVPEVQASSPEQVVREVQSGLVVFNVIMLSGALLAVVVGGLAVINTMIMSVNERTREIGLKKAVGASDWDIVGEYVAEAALIGSIGGTIGLLLGSMTAAFLNQTVSQALGGTDLFTVTPRLIVTSLLFAILLGAGAGLYPAWNAARLDPVNALRSE